MLCNAERPDPELGAQPLEFVPQQLAQPGRYRFDVAEARQGGIAGASMLVLQTVLLPLALTAGQPIRKPEYSNGTPPGVSHSLGGW
jgi:RNA 3'-terminal phosphate cyclase (ATP)